jgi:autophagy-related protein 18
LQTLDTAPNPKGIVALAPSDDNCYLAYPYSNERGDIVIFDALSLQMLNVIHSHKSPLTKLSINYTGTYIASASTKVL